MYACFVYSFWHFRCFLFSNTNFFSHIQSPKKLLGDEGAKSTTSSNTSIGNRRYSSSSDNDTSGPIDTKSTPVNAARVEPNLRAAPAPAPVVDQQRSSPGFDRAARENSSTNMRSTSGNFVYYDTIFILLLLICKYWSMYSNRIDAFYWG